MARIANAVRPRLARAEEAVRPQVARAVEAVKPRLAHAVDITKPQLARLTAVRPGKTWQYTAVAAGAGLALTAVVVSAAGPWDSTGQRTAERHRAVALDGTGGADHDGTSGGEGVPAPAPSAGSVLAGLGTAARGAARATPTPASLAAVLDPLLKNPALGSRHTAVVVDVATGERLYGAGPDQALTPASTTKIATAVAALSALGADHRFTTRAVLEPDTEELVLVGGGDPTLTAHAETDGWAGLRDLARKTAKALKKRGLDEITLSYDTTLFTGSQVHPIGVNDNLAPVTALTADEGRTDDSTSGPVTRVADPAADATKKFASVLREQGVKTTAPGPSKATSRSESLAEVTSPPLSTLVERMLTNSDNDIAETLARQVAVAAGTRADFAGGGRAVAATLTRLGLPLKGTAFRDGSGLDRDDRLTAHLLTALLVTAGDPGRPELRAVLTGLPVAGFTGTLAGRYGDGAAGVVRAKTGTLTGVNTLAGTVVDRDGRMLAFAFLTADTTDPGAAQSALDRAATALAGCGCG
ncbi:D-alanyl-D-alanine carboxypeptidase/D-alanyl-D-alanine-endopeptidase [Streptomyces sp. NPDC096080]|uniref:D-alanyl-D-alanine carboxypeptidase/D-alanyl-D-alanine endopeptidase n=1 Tax=Streptomyces sp. NPDC096080 TaxID=3156693 RepID=UPI0033334297